MLTSRYNIKSYNTNFLHQANIFIEHKNRKKDD